jgi:hypothetical protein
MSEVVVKHFQAGLLFATASSALYFVFSLLFHVTRYVPRPPLLTLALISLVGIICNPLSAFSFLRSIVRPEDVALEVWHLGF